MLALGLVEGRELDEDRLGAVGPRGVGEAESQAAGRPRVTGQDLDVR